MEQNKYRRLYTAGLGVIFVLASVLTIQLMLPTGDISIGKDHILVPGLGYDAANSYCKEIEGTLPVRDWFSALFMYEGRLLRWFIEVIVGGFVDGISTIKVMIILTDIIIAVNFFYLLTLAMKKSMLYALMAGAFLCYYSYCRCSMGVVLDHFFCAPFVSSITLCTILYKSRKKAVRVVSIVLLILALWHMIEFRKNSALLLPVYFYFLTSQLTNYMFHIKGACAVLTTLVFYFVFSNLVSFVLPVKLTHPSGPMVESDMRIAAILTNQHMQERARFEGMGLRIKEHHCVNILSPYYDSINGDINVIRKLYMQSWLDNPKDMLMSKLIQIVQFYNSGMMPEFIKKAIDEHYPQMSQNQERWNLPFGRKPFYFSIVKWVLFIFPMVLLVFMLLARKKSWFTKSEYLLIFYSSSLAIIYSLSYIIVTPTPHFRYLIPSYMIALTLLSYLGVGLLGVVVERIRLKSAR